jgi:AcrR family transcriptional regulator
MKGRGFRRMDEIISAPGPKRVKSGNRQNTLARIALTMLAEGGFEGLRVRDVANAAGINIATLHYYFPTKEDLIYAVGEEIFQQFLSVTAPITENSQVRPDRQLRQVFEDMQHQFDRVPDLFVALHELQLRAHRDETVRRIVQQVHGRWQANMEGIYRAGVKQNIFRPDIEPSQAATALIALLSGSSLQAVSKETTGDLAWAANQLVTSFLLPGQL